MKGTTVPVAFEALCVLLPRLDFKWWWWDEMGFSGREKEKEIEKMEGGVISGGVMDMSEYSTDVHIFLPFFFPFFLFLFLFEMR